VAWTAPSAPLVESTSVLSDCRKSKTLLIFSAETCRFPSSWLPF